MEPTFSALRNIYAQLCPFQVYFQEHGPLHIWRGLNIGTVEYLQVKLKITFCLLAENYKSSPLKGNRKTIHNAGVKCLH